MTALYTHGEWAVKAGHEREFVEAWLALDEWTQREYGARVGMLLRDRDDPTHFVSWVSWEQFEQVAERRASPVFGEKVDQIMEHVVTHRPSALDVVSES